MKVSITFDVSEYWRKVISYNLGLDKPASYLHTSDFIAGLVWGSLEDIAVAYDKYDKKEWDAKNNAKI